MAVVVLVSGANEERLELPDAGALAPPARRALAGVWAFRANAEREAEQRFARLGRELRVVGSAALAIELAERAVGEERRHHALCRAMVEAYGGDSPLEPPVSALPLGGTRFEHRDRVLYEVVAFCCITETLNSALMRVSHSAAREPGARAALRTILRDEIHHSRIGWAHLAHERARERGDFLAAEIPRMLAGAVREELFSPSPAGEHEAALREHGELPEPVRLAIFEAAARDVIAPGLEALGLDTGPMWRWVEGARRSRFRALS